MRVASKVSSSEGIGLAPVSSCGLWVKSVKTCSISVSTGWCWCGVPFGEHAWPFSTCRPRLIAGRAYATNTTTPHGYVHWCVCVPVCARACAVWWTCFAHSRLRTSISRASRAHTDPAHAGSRSAAKAVPSGLSPWTP